VADRLWLTAQEPPGVETGYPLVEEIKAKY